MKKRSLMVEKKARVLLGVVLFFAFVIGLFFFSQFTFAYTRGNQLFNVTFNLVNISGRQYTPYCLTECHLPLVVSYDGLVAPSSFVLDLTKIKYASISKGLNLSSVSIEYLNITQVSVLDYQKNCSFFNITVENSTQQIEDCVQVVSGSHLENSSQWLPITSLTFEKKKKYYIDFIGLVTPSLENTALDLIPSFNLGGIEYNFTELAWWNTSWSRCVNMNVTGAQENLRNFPFFVNITYDSDMQSNFNDVRFINNSCENGGSDMSYEIEYSVNSSFAHAWIKTNPNLSMGVNRFSMYYGNAGVGSGQNPPQVWTEGYYAVYHMANNTVAKDSKGIYNMTRYGIIYSDWGMMSTALNFTNATTGQATTSGIKNITFSQDITRLNIEVIWNYRNAPLTGYKWILKDSAAGNGNENNRYEGDGYIVHRVDATDQVGTSFTSNANQWYYSIADWNSSATVMYRDKDKKSYNVRAGTQTVNEFGLMPDLQAFRGVVDEMRWSNVSRSSAWMNRSVDNTNFSFFSFGSEIVLVPLGVPIVSFISGNPFNNENTTNTSIKINTSIVLTNLSSLSQVVFNWNTTNYTIYDKDLLLHLNFNNFSSLGENGTYVVDTSLLSNNLTINGSVWNQTGVYGGSYSFNGRNNSMSASNNPFDFASSFTVSVWVYSTINTTSDQRILATQESGSGVAGGFSVQFSISNAIFCSITNASKTSITVTSGIISNNVWNHVLCDFNLSSTVANVSVYINNNLNGSSRNTGFGNNITKNTTNFFRVGGPPNSASNTQIFNGSIDAISIWNKSLNSSQISNLYNSNLYKFNTTQWFFSSNISNLSNGNYTYLLSANSSLGSYVDTGLWNFSVLASLSDITPPELVLYSYGGTSGDIIPFNGIASFLVNFTVNDTSFQGCFYSVNNSANVTISCNNATSNTILTSFDHAGNYSFFLYVNDTFGNLNYTNFTYFLVMGGQQKIGPISSILNDPEKLQEETKTFFSGVWLFFRSNPWIFILALISVLMFKQGRKIVVMRGDRKK